MIIWHEYFKAILRRNTKSQLMSQHVLNLAYGLCFLEVSLLGHERKEWYFCAYAIQKV